MLINNGGGMTSAPCVFSSMRKLYRFLLHIKLWQFVILAFIAAYIPTFIWGLLPFTDYTHPFDSASFIQQFLSHIIAAPLTETLLFQTMIIGVGSIILKHWRLGNFKFKHHSWPLIILSAVVFGLVHNYHWSYQVGTSILGLVLGFAYYVARKRRQNAYITVVIIHAIFNVPAVLERALDSRITSFF